MRLISCLTLCVFASVAMGQPAFGPRRHSIADVSVFPRKKLDDPKSIGPRIRFGAIVDVVAEQRFQGKDFAELKEPGDKGRVLGWVLKRDLGSAKESDPTMEPDDPVSLEKLGPLDLKMASLYNARGKYLKEQATKLGVKAAALAAVLQIESSGRGFGSDGRVTLRLENHVLQRQLGKPHAAKFAEHFKFDAKQKFKGHQWRADPQGAWEACHVSQDQEWRAMTFAQSIDDSAAKKSASIGAGQIMGFNHKTVGYATVQEMYAKFDESIRPQLDAVVEFIRKHPLCMEGLKTNDYVKFARCYNGAGQDERYGALISAAATSYAKVTRGAKHGD